ncbi:MULTISPECIES: alcohol dehydrogenase catalytic domain-containing protein [unclassified Pseudonocardia]|uniref:alcohol dehydrogenase catalytic domain-containing protein n=1 Tax=unclassified Pseudonocardia TaxID=2619320 RepID=UPI00094AE67F|nr:MULTISPECIES: alcohol dehydrogenase catalytic domain-containing protein [unclassified Pseudonocardia]
MPLPDDLGPGETLVRIDLATVCGSDRHSVAGRRPCPAPCVLGHEQVGTVVATGAPAPSCVDGTPVAPGLRVLWSVAASCGACSRCRAGLEQKCRVLHKYGHEPLDATSPLTGGFASHCRLWPGTALAAVPATVPDEVAAPGSCATATVSAALGNGPADLRGCRVLVTGAGMLGLTATAMAAHAGAEVVVSARDTARRRWAGAFGAHEVTGAGSPVSGVDLAMETSGSALAVTRCVESLAVGGTAVLTGSVSPGPAVALDPQALLRGLHRVVGVHNYRPDDLGTAVAFLAEAHSRYPFAELVTGRYHLDQLDAAFAAGDDGAPRQAVTPTVSRSGPGGAADDDRAGIGAQRDRERSIGT